jgi:hypothetical protein
MTFKKSLIAACICTFGAGQAMAAVSEAEAAKLGASLTPMGAEAAGNADGSIPAFDANLKLTNPSTDGTLGNPMPAGEKPLYSITKANMGDYESMLSAGQIELLNTKEGYRMDVFKTVRSATFPQVVNDNVMANATTATLINDGLTLSNAKFGTPFPIPQNGLEAIWNHLVRYVGPTAGGTSSSYYVDSAGNAVRSSTQTVEFSSPLNTPELNWADEDKNEWVLYRADFQAPARRAGEITLVREPIDFSDGNGRKAWQYLAGQRRVRRAPSVSFDTPQPSTAGNSTYDDTYVYNGSPERYDWKLIGKQECIVPYNNWGNATLPVSEQANMLTKGHFNPDYARWEKHRCWVIEANLKEGQRHVYKTRRFYADEDSWTLLMADMYDTQDTLWRTHQSLFAHNYVTSAMWGGTSVVYDFQSKIYSTGGISDEGRPVHAKDHGASYYTPGALKRSGVR